MAGSYEEVIGPLLQTADPDLQRFAAATKAYIEVEYRETFGLGEAVANRRAECPPEVSATRRSLSRLHQTCLKPLLESANPGTLCD